MAGSIIAIISFIIFSVVKPTNISSKAQYQNRARLDKSGQLPAEETAQKKQSPVLTTKIPAKEKPIYPSTQVSLGSPRETVSDNQTQRELNTTAPLEKHTVTQGETLSSISLYYYGDTAHWNDILNANRNILTNPNNLRPGMQLVIPNQTR